ncbi:MAG: hypothetical protein NZM43_06365 [Saprospiraceae bacterium]|nr:hypothetical protein [Saprospiraceae bacterium]MDW8483935.1 hypothetical protein [Saprospiraceae bacterium]
MADFAETEIIGLDTTRGQYFFYLHPGVTWLAVGDNFVRSNLFLRSLPGMQVEVFTGEHFPRCLSRPEYFIWDQRLPDRLVYDNQQYLRFSLDLQVHEGALSVAITVPADHPYGITATRCPSCGL